MARTSQARASKLAVVTGETTQIAFGQAGGSGVTTIVTIPQAVAILAVVVTGHTGTTAMYIATDSANTFTVTHNSGDYFDWMAAVKAKM